ncbi:MAG: hypothetical protein LBT74_07585 [Acidobacteriota bacterium]|jgi:hypothetical protein|nr:hypothetical protein [Acidobacteriota bacterium]
MEMKTRDRIRFATATVAPALALALLLAAAAPAWARYKAPGWEAGPREGYPASLSSEGVTIAVEPLYTDELAARAFDKKDLVTRGIMPFGVVIFNDNDFPVEVDGLSIELIHKERGDVHVKTMPPSEVVWRVSRRDKTWRTQRIPRLEPDGFDKDMLEDFDGKFLMDATAPPHGKAGGFLYLHLPLGEAPSAEEVAAFLSGALLYIPKIYRQDDGSRMIYFEVDLAPAVKR